MTLVVALLLMAAWMRSLVNQENVTIHRGPGWNYVIHSRDGRLYWIRDVISYGQLELWSVSYWSLILPLTLFSAYLLLVKTHATKDAK